MTNVSKKPLTTDLRHQLYKQFAQIFAMSSEQNVSLLLLELFTESEQIMFIKRLGIIMMLNKGCSTYKISRMLDVSDATVRSTKAKLLEGEYNRLLKVTKSNKCDSKKCWLVIDKVLCAGLPPRSGSNRWGFLYK